MELKLLVILETNIKNKIFCSHSAHCIKCPTQSHRNKFKTKEISNLKRIMNKRFVRQFQECRS